MDFKNRVLSLIAQVPPGHVAGYGQIAAAAGSPRAARQVGSILRALPSDTKIPWWRIINSQGYLSIRGNWIADKNLQRKLLIDEGVEVGDEMVVDMEKYRWDIKK